MTSPRCDPRLSRYHPEPGVPYTTDRNISCSACHTFQDREIQSEEAVNLMNSYILWVNFRDANLPGSEFTDGG